MHRRQYLVRAGTAAAGIGILTLSAGCLGDASGSPDANDAGTDADTGDRVGERAVDRAAGKLNGAARPLDELGGLEDPDAVEFEPEEPRTKLAEGRDHLETADAELGDDRRADIDTLRSYADALEGLIDATATVTDEGLTEDIDAVTAAVEAGSDIEAASETVGERRAEIADARERWDEADATIRDLDGDRLGELAGVALADLEEGATVLGGVVSSFETLAAAYDATLDVEEGYGALERGRERSDNGEYDAARAEFETADATFSASHRRLERGLADAPEGLEGHFETAECQNRQLASAAAEFAAASAAASNDDPSATEHRNEAEAALDGVGTCSA